MSPRRAFGWQIIEYLRAWVGAHPRLASAIAYVIVRIPLLRRLLAERYYIHLAGPRAIDLGVERGYRGSLPSTAKDLNPRQKRVFDQWQDAGNRRHGS